MTQLAEEPEFELCKGRMVGATHPVFVIAEIGQNHQGSLDMAKELILFAKRAGADCVKFQKSDLDEKFTASVLQRPYLNDASWGRTYGEHKAFLEFSKDQFRELKTFAEDNDILFSSSAMDWKSADFLRSLELPFLKVGSGDADNALLISRLAAAKDLKLIISTGMLDLDGVSNIYDLLKQHRHQRINCALLQCTSAYPTPFADVNLRVIETYRQLFPDVVVGYSGHEVGFVPTLGAVALGAKIVERHITLDKSMRGSDHCCSLDVSEFSEMVKAIRVLERSLGSPQKAMSASEEKCKLKLGKSVVAVRRLAAGKTLVLEDLAVKVCSPRGHDPRRVHDLVGKTLAVQVGPDEPIEASMLRKAESSTTMLEMSSTLS